MNRPNSRRRSLRACRVALPLLLAAAGVACVHRPYIQQGNYLEMTDVDQVTTGMTRSQVRYLLGTPMISDPFTAQRWDYIYTLKRGRARKIDRAHFVVYFTEDKVSRIEKLDTPEATEGIETGLPDVERSESEQQAVARPPGGEDEEAGRRPEPDAPPPPEGG
jgi:outer membrane protein assembly factor BamE